MKDNKKTTTADTYAAEIIIKGRTVTRARVLEVLAECDELGAADFLQQHGYRDAVRFHLRHDGRSYPSKAVLGVAAGLDASEFFGGARGTVAHLGRLGFYVRNSATGEIVDPTLEGLRRDLIAAGLDVAESAWPEPAVTPAAYFLSGSNRPAEIRGLGIAGADVGVAADQRFAPPEGQHARTGGRAQRSDVLAQMRCAIQPGSAKCHPFGMFHGCHFPRDATSPYSPSMRRIASVSEWLHTSTSGRKIRVVHQRTTRL